MYLEGYTSKGRGGRVGKVRGGGEEGEGVCPLPQEENRKVGVYGRSMRYSDRADVG